VSGTGEFFCLSLCFTCIALLRVSLCVVEVEAVQRDESARTPYVSARIMCVCASAKIHTHRNEQTYVKRLSVVQRY
jgi:hypothetical protein